jgi:predicted permease
VTLESPKVGAAETASTVELVSRLRTVTTMPVWIHELLNLSQVVLPVFLVIALGFALRRGDMLSVTGTIDLARVTYWIALPCQLFVVVAASDLRHVFDWASAGAAIAGFVIGLALVLWGSRSLPPAEQGSLSTCICRANAAFVGLPMMQLVARVLPAEEGQHLQAAYTVLIPLMVPAFNVGSTLGFLLPQHGVTAHGLRKIFAQLLRNPLIIASLAGILASLAGGLEMLGGTVGATLGLLAAAATPMALLATGAELDLAVLRARPGLLMLACLGKLILLPGLTWLIGWLIGANSVALAAAVMLMACPTAVASGPMARQLGGDEAMVAAIIVASTVAAPITLVMWLAVLI